MLAPAFATRWTIENVDVAIASSAFIRDRISSPKQRRNVEVIHPFLRPDILRERLGTPSARSGPPRLLYLGSHKILRGEEDFLELLAILRTRIPDIEGVAITTHPIPKRVHRQVESLGIEKSVKFLSRDIELDVPSLMETSDLYVFTGLPPVGSIDPPLSIIESLILGTPVASYDAGGISEVLDSDNLVRYGDRKALSKLAITLLEKKGTTRQRPDLLESFSSETAVKRFEEIYHKVS
jgi:glycosyltransferase involved in cell wall biosynthesis